MYQGDKMNFSNALEHLKMGHCMQREGWNGKDQYIYLVQGSSFVVNRPPLNQILPEGTEVSYREHIDMKYQDGRYGVWSPSMGDIMAEDWIQLEKVI